jgi:hypothetical protein
MGGPHNRKVISFRCETEEDEQFLEHMRAPGESMQAVMRRIVTYARTSFDDVKEITR